jgi:hypothetical protein
MPPTHRRPRAIQFSGLVPVSCSLPLDGGGQGWG